MVASCLLGGFGVSPSSSSSVFLVFSCFSFLFAEFFIFPFYLIRSGLSLGCGGFHVFFLLVFFFGGGGG